MRFRRRPSGAAAIAAHQHEFFAGHPVAERRWAGSRIGQRVPGFSVHEFGPGPRYPGWTYATVGVWDATHDEHGHGMEFLLSTAAPTERAAELLTIAAYYHAGPPSQRLGIGHTTPIGEAWLPGSACDHYLVSVPYPYWPGLESCAWDGGHVIYGWLLPITYAEREYKRRAGLEALEQRFEAAAIDPTDPLRPSVA